MFAEVSTVASMASTRHTATTLNEAIRSIKSRL